MAAADTGADRGALSNARVLVVANEQVGARMAGPAIRSLNLARQLARRGARVTLATPGEIDAPDMLDGLEYAAFGTPSPGTFAGLARAHDVVVSQPQRVDIAHALERTGTPVVYDLYVPSFVERIAQLATEPLDQTLRERLLERDRLEYAAAVRLGDAFICASEQQKDHWLGALGQAGRLDLGLVERDRAATALLGVVPFGIADDAPAPLEAGEGALRGTLVEPDAVVVLWTGGLWNWFDPVTLVEGLARARAREPRLQLVVMGMHHPEAAWEEQEASRLMRERARELGLLEGGRAAGVVLCDTWIPYAERHRFLLDADAGVSAHHDGLETRLSFRTRLLDHLWAGLPTITTAGGELSDRMVAAGAALAVADGDVDGWAAALEQVARGRDADGNDALRRAAHAVADRYRWAHTTAPLADIAARLASGERCAAPARSLTSRERARYVSLLLRIRAQAKGIGSIGAAIRGARGR